MAATDAFAKTNECDAISQNLLQVNIVLIRSAGEAAQELKEMNIESSKSSGIESKPLEAGPEGPDVILLLFADRTEAPSSAERLLPRQEQTAEGYTARLVCIVYHSATTTFPEKEHTEDALSVPQHTHGGATAEIVIAQQAQTHSASSTQSTGQGLAALISDTISDACTAKNTTLLQRAPD